jgi:hypothetical protein
LTDRLDPDAILGNLDGTDHPQNLQLVSDRILTPLLDG